MVIEIKTFSPRSHIEVCSVINFTGSTVLETRFKPGDCYGFFLIESDPESLDSFSFIDDSEIQWEEDACES
jgi:hypothetical protein